jgi:predicted amidohydrolase
MLRYVFQTRMSLKKVKNYLSKVDEAKNQKKNSDTVRISCVQRAIKITTSFEEYAERIKAFVEEAAVRESDVVVFPEYNFFDLFGLIPGFKKVNDLLNSSLEKKREASESKGGGEGILRYLFREISVPYQKSYEELMKGLAKKYGIYIYTGSYIISENGRLYNGGSLVSREGEILGRQKKIHLTDFEEKIGFYREKELKVFSLDIGKVACPVCMDATYFETFRMAYEMGADIVLLPIANNEEYNFWRALRGIWPRVQESYVYGAKASLNGWIGGIHFTGRAGIFAPIDMTENEDGVLAVSPYYEGDFLVTTDLDVAKLHDAREKAEYFGDRNETFEKGYYEKVYKPLLKGERG